MTNLIIAVCCAFYLGTEYSRCKSAKLIKSLLEEYAKEGKTLQDLIDDFNEEDKSGGSRGRDAANAVLEAEKGGAA